MGQWTLGSRERALRGLVRDRTSCCIICCCNISYCVRFISYGVVLYCIASPPGRKARLLHAVEGEVLLFRRPVLLRRAFRLRAYITCYVRYAMYYTLYTVHYTRYTIQYKLHTSDRCVQPSGTFLSPACSQRFKIRRSSACVCFHSRAVVLGPYRNHPPHKFGSLTLAGVKCSVSTSDNFLILTIVA